MVVKARDNDGTTHRVGDQEHREAEREHERLERVGERAREEHDGRPGARKGDQRPQLPRLDVVRLVLAVAQQLARARVQRRVYSQLET